ncbi:FtsX-like permease family protein [Paenibacillus sepulcri]|uniref:FtsX-like permease family protein n=1 Tax=Paenibacillus sepulcri TaxID=359917 RepID=A0ABS7C6R9_9BACL|nr:FtsX-like permease family protein [Paenibacillus sepulcri]
MLIKLALTGMTSKFKNYVVLLAGLIMAIAIFYMFQTLAWNKEFIKSNSVINHIELVYLMGSFLLSVVTFFYIIYASSFLFSLRQREFGMYMTLGARKKKINMLLFIENMVMGGISLLLGIALGIGLAAVVGQLMASQLDVDLAGYHPLFGPSIAITIIFFIALFLLSALWNYAKLSRMRLLQLIHADKQPERIPVMSRIKWFISVLGILALGIGYVCLVFMEQLREIGLLVATVMTTLGTYLIFISLVPLLINRLKSVKSQANKGIHAFTFGQLSFRINGLTKMLATVAMLIALSAGAISGGMAFQNNAFIAAESYKIYDVTIHNPTAEELKLLSGITFTEEHAYHYKMHDQTVYFLLEDMVKGRPLTHTGTTKKEWEQYTRLADKIAAGSMDDGSLSQEWINFLYELQPPAVEIGQMQLVDSGAFNKIEAASRVAMIGKTASFTTNKRTWKQLDQMEAKKYENVGYYPQSKNEYYQSKLGFASGTVFMGFFLGIAFLAMMASCLMFKILSGASRDANRYRMLHKIGVRRSRLSASIYKELFLVFLIPGVVGLSHVLVGMNLFSFILVNPYYRIWIPLVIFMVIYTIYYFLTVYLYKRAVLPGKQV